MGGQPEGDSAGRGMCVGSLCQLLEAGSLKAAAPAAPTASWIRDLHTGSTWSPAKRCSRCRRLCKVSSDCFPFLRQPLWKRLFPLRTQGKWGMGGNPRSLCGQKRLAWSCSLDPLCLLHTLTSQVSRGMVWTGLQDVPAMVQSPMGVEHGFAFLLRPAWAKALLRARRDLEGGDSFMEQRPS